MALLPARPSLGQQHRTLLGCALSGGTHLAVLRGPFSGALPHLFLNTDVFHLCDTLQQREV